MGKSGRDGMKLVSDNAMVTLTKPHRHCFHCEKCGANVFGQYVDDAGKEYFICNSCDSMYEAE